ncbi:hypothetical protein A2Z22_03340 [Candidatus Woesebacteria bacterium RBG_16_34_12]|uniref:Uncharacterized protein n=1 Tax=Candidatus Woesebacteria bacterium RBG_16_34_12 TaxID=1802480 RepID=A0A1F7XBG2_9BACT|nr:MAG: hypothetical protein A2Z22_03340 [Candidatus Woesebacteria bacterium RBG_16_34_12]
METNNPAENVIPIIKEYGKRVAAGESLSLLERVSIVLAKFSLKLANYNQYQIDALIKAGEIEWRFGRSVERQ